MAIWIILSVLSVLYAAIGIACFAEQQRRTQSEQKVVSLPKFLFWVGLGTGFVFLAMAWCAAAQDGSLWITVLFAVFLLMSLWLMLGWKNCCIFYDKKGFTQKNFIGMVRSFTYAQLTAEWQDHRAPLKATVCAEEKRISWNVTCENGKDFLVTALAGYRSAHHNQDLPLLAPPEKGLSAFASHVYNPGQYLFPFILLMLFFVGFMVAVVIVDWMPVTEEKCQQYTIPFSSWQTDKDKLVLTTPQIPEKFEIWCFEDYLSNPEQLKAKCDSTTKFTVWAKRIDPDSAPPYFRIFALSVGEENYLTFQDSTAYQRAQIPYHLSIFGILTLIVLGLSAFFYIVGSYPEKFPKWVVYACFKKDAIDF